MLFRNICQRVRLELPEHTLNLVSSPLIFQGKLSLGLQLETLKIILRKMCALFSPDIFGHLNEMSMPCLGQKCSLLLL